MSDYDYENPTLDAIDEAEMDAALAADAAKPKRSGFTPLPRGRYTGLLTDETKETVTFDNSPLFGKTRIRATFETEHDGRTRKLFVDLTTTAAKWPERDGKQEYVRDYLLFGQLRNALGMVGKPEQEVLDQARIAPVDLEVGIDKKKPDRNVVYAVHSTVR